MEKERITEKLRACISQVFHLICEYLTGTRSFESERQHAVTVDTAPVRRVSRTEIAVSAQGRVAFLFGASGFGTIITASGDNRFRNALGILGVELISTICPSLISSKSSSAGTSFPLP